MKIEVSEQTIDEALMALSTKAHEMRRWAEEAVTETFLEECIDWYFEADLRRRELSWARGRADYEEFMGEVAPVTYMSWLVPSAIDVELERHRRFGIPPSPDSHQRGLGAIAGALRIISLEAAS